MLTGMKRNLGAESFDPSDDCCGEIGMMDLGSFSMLGLFLHSD
jgi:hypothetical protein